MDKVVAIGIEDFKTVIDSDYYYVDKSGLIAELLQLVPSDEKTEVPVRKAKPALNGVSLFLRPRRFGKTLTISMLRYFFDIDEKENAYLFDGLAISKEKSICAEFQNRFPVISLTLKGISGPSQESYLSSLNAILAGEYVRHAKSVDWVENENERERFARIREGKASFDDFKFYLSILTKALYREYGVKPVVLIDEYDVPLNNAHRDGQYGLMVGVIKEMFSNGMKTNGALQAGIITGCLQIAKNQIFTGLNNPGIYTVARPVFARYFGFTKEETAEMLHYFGLDDRAKDVRDNYDGYTIGKYSIYNPYSLLNFIMDTRADRKAACQNYWASTSGDALLWEMLGSCKKSQELKEVFEKLLSFTSAKVEVDKTVVYDTMMKSPAAIMGTLLFSGYLTVTKAFKNGSYRLRIPNREVLSCFRSLVDQYNKTESTVPNGLLLDAFVKGNVIQARSFLENSLKTVISYHDMAIDKEDFPHGFLLGVLTATAKGPSWIIKSNRETGLGRSDIFLADWKGHEAIIIEVKRAETEGEMERKLAEGLEQIEKNAYDADYDKDTFTVRKYCVCFCGKMVKVKMAE